MSQQLLEYFTDTTEFITVHTLVQLCFYSFDKATAHIGRTLKHYQWIPGTYPASEKDKLH